MKIKIIIIIVFLNTLNSYSQQIGDGYAPSIIPNFSAALKSGIYNGLTNSTVGMVPDNSNTWQHLFAMRHINQSNNYQLQIASTFTVNDRLFFRKITAGDLSASNTTWNELATRSANTFEGNQIMNGNLGIGTSAPLAKLEVKNGNILVRNAINTNGNSSIMIAHSINVSNLDTFGTSIRTITQDAGTNVYGLQLFTQEHYSKGQTEKVRILGNGNVGIGSTNPDSKLTVKGKIHAEEVKVDLAVPADYVFEKYYLGESSLKPDYQLLTLSEVEKFTKENHHLPNVPSAGEIKENGLQLGEMSNMLLQKIEELTLYSIEQQKTIHRLEKENESFKKLEDRLIRLEKELDAKK